MNHTILAYGLLESWDIISHDNFSLQQNNDTWQIYLMVDDYLNHWYEDISRKESEQREWERQWNEYHS